MKQGITKLETKYDLTFTVNKNWENVGIITDDNDRLKIEIYAERWRSKKETIELLEKTIKYLKEINI